MAEAADGAESIDAAAGVDSQCAGSPITRARKNLAALEALAAAEERGSATAEEIAAMEAYSGWGGAQKAFSENAEGEWGEIRDRLKELLSDDEFASQRHTVLTAFYTPAPVIGAIYDALREAGIGHGDTRAAGSIWTSSPTSWRPTCRPRSSAWATSWSPTPTTRRT